MEAFIIIFILTLAASLLPLLINTKKKIWLPFLLSFSGSFLLGVTLLHIIPELYEHTSSSFKVGVFIMIGFFIQVVLESYSKGIEHGHIHIHDFGKLPYGLFIALTLHALLEGSVLNDVHILPKHDVVFGILIHKIPVAFLLGLLFFSLNISKFQAFILLCVFSIATPAGAFITSVFKQLSFFEMSLENMLKALATGSFYMCLLLFYLKQALTINSK